MNKLRENEVNEMYYRTGLDRFYERYGRAIALGHNRLVNGEYGKFDPRSPQCDVNESAALGCIDYLLTPTDLPFRRNK